VKKGISYAQEIKQMMIDFRENPPTEIAGHKVVIIEDCRPANAAILV
jgi:phosphoglucomutase